MLNTIPNEINKNVEEMSAGASLDYVCYHVNQLCLLACKSAMSAGASFGLEPAAPDHEMNVRAGTIITRRASHLFTK